MTDGEHYAASQDAAQRLNSAIEDAKSAGLSVSVEAFDARTIGDPGPVDLVTAKVFRPIRGAS